MLKFLKNHSGKVSNYCLQVGTYISINLKSFYASMECIERKLDPVNVSLVSAKMNQEQKNYIFSNFFIIFL